MLFIEFCQFFFSLSQCYLLILKQVFIYTRKQACLDNITAKSTCLLAVISHELLPRLLATGIFPARTFCCQNVKFKVYWLTKKYPVPLYCGLSRQELPTYEKLISISRLRMVKNIIFFWDRKKIFFTHWKTVFRVTEHFCIKWTFWKNAFFCPKNAFFWKKWQFEPLHRTAPRRCQRTFFLGGNFTPIFEAKK